MVDEESKRVGRSLSLATASVLTTAADLPVFSRSQREQSMTVLASRVVSAALRDIDADDGCRRAPFLDHPIG
jgi:hypothetical protein